MPFGLRKKGNTVPPLYSAPCSQQGRLFPAWINEPFVRRSEPVRTAFVSLLEIKQTRMGSFRTALETPSPGKAEALEGGLHTTASAKSSSSPHAETEREEAQSAHTGVGSTPLQGRGSPAPGAGARERERGERGDRAFSCCRLAATLNTQSHFLFEFL